MADETRESPEGMLIVEWSGATMLAGGATGRPLGADAWPVLERLAARGEAPAGVLRTGDSGLISGVAALVDGPAEAGSPAPWAFAAEATEPETLRLETPREEAPAEAPARRTSRSLFGPAARPATPRTPATAPKATAGAPVPAAEAAPERSTTPATPATSTSTPTVPPARPTRTAAARPEAGPVRRAPAGRAPAAAGATPERPAAPVRPDATPRGTLVREAGPALRAARAPRFRPVTATRGPTAPVATPATPSARPAPGPSGDLLAALRLRSPASGPGAPAAGPAARPSGLLSVMDLPALAAAGTTPPAPRPRPVDEAERTVLVATAPAAPDEDAPAAAPAPRTRKASTARPVAPAAPAPVPEARTGAKAATVSAPAPAAATPANAPEPPATRTTIPGTTFARPAFGPTPLSRGADRPAAALPGPGLATAWQPARSAPADGGSMLDALGPALSRLASVADGPREPREGSPAGGPLPEADLLALAPAAPTPPDPAPSARMRGRSGASRTVPVAPRPAPAPIAAPAARPPAARPAAPAVIPQRAASSVSAAPAPGIAAIPTGPAVQARTPRAAGSLTLSVPVAQAPVGAASGRPFHRAPGTGAPFPAMPSARGPLASWLSFVPTAPGTGPAATGAPPRGGVLDAGGDDPRTFLQVAATGRPDAGDDTGVPVPAGRAPSRRAATAAPRTAPAPVLPERTLPAAPPGPVAASAATAPAPTRAPRPSAAAPSAPAGDLADAVVAPMGRTLARAASDDTLRATVRSVDPFGDRLVSGTEAPSWTAVGDDEATLVALAAPEPAPAEAAPTSPAGRRSTARAAAPRPAPSRPAPATTPTPAPVPQPIRTATPVSRRSVPLAAVARAGLRAADRPLSLSGLRPRSAAGRRPGTGGLPALATGTDDRAFVAAPTAAGTPGSDSPADVRATARRGSLFAPVVPTPARGLATQRSDGALPAPASPAAASGTAPGAVPASLDLPLPEGFDVVGLRSPVVPAFARGALARAGGFAESLGAVRRTLFRSLGALPAARQDAPARPAAATASDLALPPGTPDLVEWIRIAGGGRPAGLAAQDASPGPGARSARVAATRAGRPPVAAGDDDRAFVDVGASPDGGAVHPEAIHGTLPGLPYVAPAAQRFDVSLSDRGLVSPGGIASALAGLSAASAPALTGPTYHGSMPLVSTALSSVAATALAATRGEEPAAAPAAPQAAEPAAGGGAPVDLDGLAAEMAERILRRLKRDKERRGFYG